MRLRVIIRLIGVIHLSLSCQSKQDTTGSSQHFPTHDYVAAGKRLPHVQTLYIIDLAKHSKRLVFVGCTHVRDSTDRQFTTLQRLFAELKPQIGVNEGGQLKQSQHYPSMHKAAFQAAETGVMNRPFELALTQAVEQFDYINGGSCHFCAIGRRSKMIRDSVLLTKLDRALDRYDRVMVTFGCGHALAVEPALRELVNKKRG